MFSSFVPSDRGAGVIFDKTAVESFLVGSHLSLLVRAPMLLQARFSLT